MPVSTYLITTPQCIISEHKKSPLKGGLSWKDYIKGSNVTLNGPGKQGFKQEIMVRDIVGYSFQLLGLR